MRWSPFLGIPICLALLSFALVKFFPLKSTRSPPPPRLFTAEQLALYNGSDPGLPILLGILGSVFDVSKGKSHYGPGGGYNHFSGRDASRAFVSGNFTGIQIQLSHFSSPCLVSFFSLIQCKILVSVVELLLFSIGPFL
ncbi:hypothetical protein CDL12_24325 [Handroanthus impetiginosus]|uniref:Cytochrome b5 heme-binding domain-containing protein n=1 Tax=Handroanthus impetiginosus TaxID=429701 RepID=A0A2G9GCY2_9LAMI|nr:hypothetical protein CDL12_24325 [Handroanthus impetiginosus]